MYVSFLIVCNIDPLCIIICIIIYIIIPVYNVKYVQNKQFLRFTKRRRKNPKVSSLPLWRPSSLIGAAVILPSRWCDCRKSRIRRAPPTTDESSGSSGTTMSDRRPERNKSGQVWGRSYTVNSVRILCLKLTYTIYTCAVYTPIKREALCSRETHAHKHHQVFMWWTEGKYLKDTENFLILIKRANNELFVPVCQKQIRVIV